MEVVLLNVLHGSITHTIIPPPLACLTVHNNGFSVYDLEHAQHGYRRINQVVTQTILMSCIEIEIANPNEDYKQQLGFLCQI